MQGQQLQQDAPIHADEDVNKKKNNPLMVKFRKACLARNVSGIKEIGRSFNIADQNRNRLLDVGEFEHIAACYTDMPQHEMKDLFKLFDHDGNGQINYEEFLFYLRPPMSQNRINLINKAFAKLDKSGDGVVTAEDLKGIYRPDEHPKYKSGEMSRNQVFQEFLNTFQADKDDTVTKEEFLNYYAGVSASIDKDVYFDFMMRQSWKL